MELPQLLRQDPDSVVTTALSKAARRLLPARLRGRLRQAALDAAVRDSVPLRFTDYEKAARRALRSAAFEQECEAMEACDLLFVNGEGSIYDRQRKGRMILFLAFLGIRYFRKPVCIVNHTAALNDPETRAAAFAVYPELADVVFREPISARQFEGVCRFAVAADAAFAYQPEATGLHAATRYLKNRELFDVERPYVCVGGSSIYLRPDRPSYDPVPAFVRLCSELRLRYGQVVLTASCATDERLFYRVVRELPMPLLCVDTPTQTAVDILGAAACYIGGRWHPAIFALTGGTPVVVLSANTFKTAGLVEHVGMSGRVYDALRLHAEVPEILAATERLIASGPTARTTILERVAALRAGIDRHVDLLGSRDVHPACNRS